MRYVFCDTSGFFALLIQRDAAHAHAASAWNSLLESDFRPITTNYVVVESLTLLQNRYGLEDARKLSKIIDSLVEVSCITSAQHEATLAELFRTNRRKLSIVDCSSFTFMRHNRVDTAFAYDPHFEEHGFTLFQNA